MFNVRLFASNRIFAFSNLAALINYAATFAIGFMLSLFLQYAKGMNPAEAGSILIAQPVVMAIVAPLSGRLSDRMQSRWLASAGMAVIVVGLLPFVFIDDSTSITLIFISLLILGMGFGLFSSPNTNAVMSSVDRSLYGVASATISTMRLTGQMLSMGIASLAVHVFVGTRRIEAENLGDFIHATQLVFSIFIILCILGIFASLARGHESQKG
ncbi:MAG: MFS transporter [Bacteroidales bacterium]